MVFFALGLLVAGAFSTGWRYLNTPLNIPSEGFVFTIPPGAPFAQVTSALFGEGVLQKPAWLRAYARIQGTATRIQAGEYQISIDATPRTLLMQFVAGQVRLHQFTMIEGQRFEEALENLRAHPAIVASELSKQNIMAEIGKPNLHWEGQFLPDTYSFPKGTSDLKILLLAHQALEKRLGSMWQDRMPGLILKNAYEALTLASIIEKETAMASERVRIAGVFHRRLEQGMLLQSDPTVIYGIGAIFDGNLRRTDLNRDTPHNTYTRAGLPPTPIALVGEAALAAALNPSSSAELYFVATGFPDGSHRFSVTLEEHDQAISEYLKELDAKTGP